MTSFISNAPRSTRDTAYYRQRHRNRVFAKVIAFINEQAEKEQITQRELAVRLGKDPAQVSRWLRHPSNLTLDTISDLLLAFDAEAELPQIVKFKDRRPANYMHPLIARIQSRAASESVLQAEPSSGTSWRAPSPSPALRSSAA